LDETDPMDPMDGMDPNRETLQARRGPWQVELRVSGAGHVTP
jgi:hypothetical protein